MEPTGKSEKSEPQMGIEPTILRNPFETGHFTSWKERERPRNA